MSEEAQERVRKNQENAQRKTYHSTMGSGGYQTAVPKWEKAEKELTDRGLVPESLEWTERARSTGFSLTEAHWTLRPERSCMGNASKLLRKDSIKPAPSLKVENGSRIEIKMS